MNEQEQKSLVCHICSKEFHSKPYNLKRHLKDIHNIMVKSEYKIKCLEDSCGFTCAKRMELRRHLDCIHGIEQEVEEWRFDNMDEFYKWKAAEEASCSTLWSKGSAFTTSCKAMRYYYCNRSGRKRIIPENQRKRQMKKQGSCKIDNSCPSAIIIRVINGQIHAKYFKTHYGHGIELKHIPLSQDVKNLIAAQLMTGISHLDLLKNIREKPETYSKKLLHVTRKCLENIAIEYNLADTNPIPRKKINRIYESHCIAEQSKNMVIMRCGKEWRIKCDGEIYYLKDNEVGNDHVCKLKCNGCGKCIHSYSCSCLDYTMSDNMCEHIHKLCMLVNSEEKKDEVEVLSIEVIEENNKFGEVIQDNSVKQEEEEIQIEVIDSDSEVKSSIQDNINKISKCRFDHTNKDTLNKVNDHLKKAIQLLEGRNEDINNSMILPNSANVSTVIVPPLMTTANASQLFVLLPPQHSTIHPANSILQKLIPQNVKPSFEKVLKRPKRERKPKVRQSSEKATCPVVVQKVTGKIKFKKVSPV